MAMVNLEFIVVHMMCTLCLLKFIIPSLTYKYDFNTIGAAGRGNNQQGGMGRGGAARQMRPPVVGTCIFSCYFSLSLHYLLLFHTYKTGPRQGGGGSNLKPPPQPRINPAPLPGTLLPGKSALVLFYLMYSCAQYEVLVI